MGNVGPINLRRTACLASITALFAAGCGSDDSDTTEAERTAAENLAIIETEDPPEDATVDKFDRLISAVQRKCGDAPDRIADYTVNVHEQLQDEAGIQESLESILFNVGDAIPPGGKVKCIDAFTTYSITQIGRK